jgi:hypothetical protein
MSFGAQPSARCILSNQDRRHAREAGIHISLRRSTSGIPAFAAMTRGGQEGSNSIQTLARAILPPPNICADPLVVRDAPLTRRS